MDRAAVVVEEVKLAILVLAERDDAHRRARDLRHLLRAVTFEAGGPQPPRLPVTEDVGAAQLGEPLAVVDAAAGDAARDRVRQFDQCRADRRRPDLVRLDRLRPFHGGPAVVAPLFDAMDRLPQLPADVADEQRASLAVKAHPPGVAEAVRPHLGPGAFSPDERVILRHGVV